MRQFLYEGELSDSAVPTLFGIRDQFLRRRFFHRPGIGEDGLGMIQVHDIYCELYFYYYCFSSTSDHQALDSRGWGPLPYAIALAAAPEEAQREQEVCCLQ